MLINNKQKLSFSNNVIYHYKYRGISLVSPLLVIAKSKGHYCVFEAAAILCLASL